MVFNDVCYFLVPWIQNLEFLGFHLGRAKFEDCD